MVTLKDAAWVGLVLGIVWLIVTLLSNNAVPARVRKDPEVVNAGNQVVYTIIGVVVMLVIFALIGRNPARIFEP